MRWGWDSGQRSNELVMFSSLPTVRKHKRTQNKTEKFKLFPKTILNLVTVFISHLTSSKLKMGKGSVSTEEGEE